MGNLFLGILVFCCILQGGGVAVIIHSGMPVLALVFGESILVMINNLFPASWIMFGRSGVYLEGDFHWDLR